jgi:hypothetical protein
MTVVAIDTDGATDLSRFTTHPVQNAMSGTSRLGVSRGVSPGEVFFIYANVRVEWKRLPSGGVLAQELQTSLQNAP